MTVADLLGPVLTTIRDDVAVAAITSRVRGGQLTKGDVAPCVVVRSLGNTRSPFGSGNARLGLQQPRLVAKCFGTTDQQASQLAGAVSDALHLKRARVISGKTIHQIMDDGWGGIVLDPVTNWSTEDVIIEVTGAA